MSEIRKLAEEVASREGCYLYDIEMVGAGNARVLRVTIDKDVNSNAAKVAASEPALAEAVSADGELMAGGHDADASDDSPDDSIEETSAEIEATGGTGVSVEDCTNVSRAMNLRLDVEDIIPGGQYQLEVSSPGLERVLKEARHFEGALNKNISVKSFAPLAQFNEVLPLELAKAKSLQGPLLSYDDKGIKVGYQPVAKKGEQPPPSIGIFIPYESITKAHVVFEFVEKAKPGQKLGHKPHPKAGKSAGKQK